MKVMKEIYMYVLGAIVIVLSFLMGYLLATHEIPASNKDVVMVSVGIILGWGSLVVGYFFASSKGSADKTELLNKKEDALALEKKNETV